MFPKKELSASPTPQEAFENPAQCDVLVIGGGPAGSTLSTLLAEKDWNVVLLEKDHHPRFHIGESLLPMNLPILERLGVLDQVRKIGLVKPGIEMYADRRPGRSQTFYFDKTLNQEFPHAFQVRRSEFDELLLRHSAQRGVEVQEGIRVTDVAFPAGEPIQVRARDGSGAKKLWSTRYVVDASGRNAFLATRMGLKEKSKKHNSAAIYGHFSNAIQRNGRDRGNIGLYWFEHGWFWMIPLPDGVMSVGAVCWPDYLKTRRNGLDEFLWDTIRLCPGVAERLEGAELAQPASATGNYTYRARQMWGDGYLLVGDAYAFIDPVFSSGVYLAMNSATMAVEAVDACLREERTVAPLLKDYEKRVLKGMRTLSWFIYRFTTPAIQGLFMAPRNLFRMEQAVLSVLSGDVFRKNGLAIPIHLFKVVYYVSTAMNLSWSWSAFRRRKRNIEPESFTHSATPGPDV